MSRSPGLKHSGGIASGLGLALILSVTAIALVFLIGANLSDEPSSAIGGSCGPSTTWTLEGGVLTISGTGEMDELNNVYGQPWSDYRGTITRINIEEGVTSIGKCSFSSMSNLQNVKIPHSVTKIGSEAFYFCDKLEEIRLHEGITEIGAQAFYNCSLIEYLYIPNSVVELTNGMIYNCTNLSQIYFSNNLRQDGHTPTSLGITGVDFYNADRTVELDDYNYNDLRGKVFVKDGDDYIETVLSGNSGNIGWSFSGGGPSGGILNIFGTGEMDDYADADEQPWGEYRLLIDVITVDENVTAIGERAFQFCGTASTVTFNSPITAIRAYAMSYMNSLEMITLPSGLTSIGDFAFRSDIGLIEITLPDGITSTGNSAFRECNSLSSVTIPDSVTTIASEAFWGCINLKEIYFGSGITTVAADAFTDVELYDTDGTTEMVKDADHLRDVMFVNKDSKPVRIPVDLTIEGHTYSLSSETNSASITADDITYLKKRVSMYQDTKLRFAMKNGYGATFDSTAIYNIGSDASTFTISSVDKSTLSDAVKELVGSHPVYTADFGNNKSFGNGKIVITVPYELSGADSADGLKANCIKDDAVSKTVACTYDDGKASFETDGMTMFFIGSNETSGGSEFPIWIPIVAAIAAIGIGAGVFVFLRRRP